MGLCDSERESGMIQTLHMLFEQYQELNEIILFSRLKNSKCCRGKNNEYKNQEIIELINNDLKDVWYLFLKEQSTNTLFWLMGSQTYSLPDLTHVNLFTDMIKVNCQDTLKGENDDCFTFERIEEQKHPLYKILDNELSLTTILTHYDKTAGILYKIFVLIEQFRYYLARYPNDDFHNKYKNIDKHLLNVCGYIYMVMVNTDLFAKAYLICQITKQLYVDDIECDEIKDPITKLLVNYDMHHNFYFGMSLNLNQISEAFMIIYNYVNRKNAICPPIPIYNSKLGGCDILTKDIVYDYDFRRLITIIILTEDKFTSKKEVKQLIETHPVLKQFKCKISEELKLSKERKDEKHQRYNRYNWSCRHLYDVEMDYNCGDIFGETSLINKDPLFPID